MSEVTVKTNIADFRRELRDLGRRIERRVVRNAVVATARALVPIARAEAPRLRSPDKRRQAGALARAIYVAKPKATAESVSARVSVRGKPAGGRKSKKVADAFYWRFLEGGWTPRGPGKRLRGGVRRRALERRRNAAGGAKSYRYPFLQPAFRKAQAQLLEVFHQRMAAGIAREQARAR
ncbi:MAG: HK97-gp10 family putative phage morphogenesis protein [Pseudomonadota bacterium]